MRSRILAMLALAALALSAGHSAAADNSWMRPTPQTAPRDSAWVKDQLRKDLPAPSTIPIGVVLVWTKSLMPDKGEWLECDGQTISAAKYPKYAAKFGTKLPDYRGQFLRGHGGKSGELGKIQKEEIGGHLHYVGEEAGWHGYYTPGWGGFDGKMKNGKFVTSSTVKSDSDKWYKDQENRPENIAVKYIIKVK